MVSNVEFVILKSTLTSASACWVVKAVQRNRQHQFIKRSNIAKQPWWRIPPFSSRRWTTAWVSKNSFRTFGISGCTSYWMGLSELLSKSNVDKLWFNLCLRDKTLIGMIFLVLWGDVRCTSKKKKIKKILMLYVNADSDLGEKNKHGSLCNCTILKIKHEVNTATMYVAPPLKLNERPCRTGHCKGQ